MLPLGIMLQNTSPLLGGIIDNHISPRLNLILTFICELCCHLLLKYSNTYWIILTAMFLYGFGNGLSYYGVLRNAWKYFPDKKGLLSGIILSCFGLSSFFFTTIADLIINPSGIQPDDDNYYPREVAENVPKFINVMCITIAIGGTIIVCLICPYRDPTEKTVSREESVVKEDEQPLSQGVFSCEFMRLCVMSACTFCKYSLYVIYI